MPAGYEAGLRVVEHYAGRQDSSKQTRGIFPSLTSGPNINPGRNVRVRDGILTGTAALTESAVSVHGVRPTASIPFDGIPQDLLPFLMSFFHNVNYTVVSVGDTDTAGDYVSPFTETGQFEFGMIDARPDNAGAVVGSYDPAAGDYKSLVAMGDAYTIGLEWLHGHGDLGDTNNGISIDNFITNRLLFEVTRGEDQVLNVTADGFGRTSDELADYAEASWGPGINGDLSAQSVFAPDTFSLQTLTIDAGDVSSTWSDWLDSLSVELLSGISGRDPLGASGFGGLATDGRPSVNVQLGAGHIDPGFITAMVNNQKIVATFRFSNGANETLDIVLPNLRVSEEFTPNQADAQSDLDVTIPMIGVVDTTATVPVCEIDLTTEFDVRTLSYFLSTTLADASTYTA